MDLERVPAFARLAGLLRVVGVVRFLGAAFFGGIGLAFDAGTGLPSPYHWPMGDWPEIGRAIRILVVEDDAEIAAVVSRILRSEGLEVQTCADGISALEQFPIYRPDVTLLDLGLPGLDGTDVLEQIRADGSDRPIIALTARDAPSARVRGLDLGADDYVLKPFDRDELLARIRAVMRRRPPEGASAISVGNLVLDPDGRLATIGGRDVELTSREFDLVAYLALNRGIVISRQRLLDQVWGYDPGSETNTIEVFISNIRRKLEANGEPRLLHTVRGSGYVIRG